MEFFGQVQLPRQTLHVILLRHLAIEDFLKVTECENHCRLIVSAKGAWYGFNQR